MSWVLFLTELMNRKQTAWMLVAFLLVMLPNLVWFLVASSRWDAFVQGVAPCVAILAGLLAWSGRRPGIVLVVLLPCSLLAPLEAYYIWNFQAPSAVHILGVLAETNLGEAREYVGDARLVALGLLPVGVFVLNWLALSQIGVSSAFPYARAWRWVAVAASLPLIGWCFIEVSTSQEHFPKVAEAQDFKQAQATENFLVSDINLGLYKLLSPGFPLGVPIRVHSYLLERQRLAVARQSLEKLTIRAANASSSAEKSVIVLVVGESATSLHWGVNGYSRDTTPKIGAMQDLVSMRQLITPWASTRMAVPVILTGQQDSEGVSPLDAPSVVAVFRAAGWKTFWLSNQSPAGVHDSAIALYAGQSDVTRYLNAGSYDTYAGFDDVLLEPFVKAVEEDAAPRKLIVLHLLGSHANYSLRYPPVFDKFKPSGMATDSSDWLAKLNGYDNSILYTDHILAELIKTLGNLPSEIAASMLYVSDHGQALPSESCRFWGHSQIAESSYRVPGLVWLSRASQLRHPSAIRQLAAKRDARLHASQVFDTLIDLAQIRYEGMSTKKSWISAEWYPQKRLFNGGRDFDEMSVEGPCHQLSSAASKH